MNYICLLFPILLAFAYRARGGAIPLNSDTLSRTLFWALPIGFVSGIVCHFQHLPLWLAIPCALLAFAGATIPHSSEQTDTIIAYEGMALIIMFMVYLILLPFMVDLGFEHTFFERPVFIAAGFLSILTFPLCWASYRIKVGLKLFGIQWCVPGDSSYEEFFIGGLFGVIFTVLGLS